MIAQFGFDTLAFVKRLSAAGMDTNQAEALAEALTVHAFDELATKADLRELAKELRSEMKEMELRLRAEIEGNGAPPDQQPNRPDGRHVTGATIAILGTLITLS